MANDAVAREDDRAGRGLRVVLTTITHEGEERGKE